MVSEPLTDTAPEAVKRDPERFVRRDGRPVEWRHADALVPYPEALDLMRARAEAIIAGTANETVWLIEHPPLYTLGTSANLAEVLTDRLPVYQTGRGGRVTYHGPGQRVAYVMLDLRARARDLRQFVNTLEDWVIGTLAEFNIFTHRRPGRVGVWVDRPDKGPDREDKIAAIGIRVTRWVSYHGISLNVAPDLADYEGIVPCGITDQGVTSFEDLGHIASLPEIDTVLRTQFEARFGPTRGATGHP